MTNDEKLARCITALRAISGDPDCDSIIAETTGENPSDTPSIKLARKTLIEIGASLKADAFIKRC